VAYATNISIAYTYLQISVKPLDSKNLPTKILQNPELSTAQLHLAVK